MTILLALASSLMWGAGDYFGGSASRRMSTLLVVLISQAAGLVVAVAATLGTGAFGAPTGYLPWAVAAGAAGSGALMLYYRALAIGTMGVVSPIASLGVVVPVVIGLFTGALPSAICLAGIAVAIVGVVATAGPSRSAGRKPGHGRSVLLAVGSAAGFGFVLFAISRGAEYSVVMTMLTMRCASVPLLLLVTAVTLGAPRRGTLREQRRRTPDRTRTRPAGIAGLAAIVLLCGVLDVGANLLFGFATTSGALAIVAVLGSLYPAGTVLLARVLDGERMTVVQNVGVAAALAGVAMIAAGS